MEKRDQTSIFNTLSQQLRRYWLRVQDDEKHGVLCFPPTEIDQVAHAIFSNLSHGGFATFVVSGRRGWDPQAYYFEAARGAARRGCKIVRAFLLPHRQYLKEEVLQLHWRLDADAGIDVKFLYVGDLLPTMLVAPPFGLDFGLWDDKLVCTAVLEQATDDRGPSEWRISSRQEDIELSLSLRDELLSRAPLLPPPGTEPESLDLEEPMVQTAPLMDLLSNAVCAGNYIAAEDCSWYHGVWQYLRIFDMVSTPTWHPDFYIPQLTLLAQQCGDASILISGTADYSVPAHVLWAFDAARARCEVTVLDSCPTPLIMSQWYARFTQHDITTVEADILTFDPGDTYDAVVTDAFLTRFPSEERRLVVKRWFQLLKPGGCVITTVRIGGLSRASRVRASPEQVDRFRSVALQRATRWQDFLPMSADQIAVKAQRYAERMTSHPVAAADEVRDEFVQQGFSFSHFELASVKGEMAPTTYVELVAEKLPAS